ncbi:MAG TPA: ferritin family protein [Candidatus Aminicenantes bacterium]|nr:ferritin family protein [Candidatus Aminicenantes bacterium]HRY66323.1 ferritin family protein [Candidatus Aminicenantes bacterium]HRZ73230.1 ferritin family protein [Candidatus Aminicenantes bacterium]
MSIDNSLQPWQILGVAVRSEIDAAAFYTRLLGRVRNLLLVQKLKFLALEEEHHRALLERLLAERYRGRPVDAPESSLMPPIGASLPADPSVQALFEAALGAEKAAEAYYNEAAGRAEDEASRHILAYLGRVERSHQAMIGSELDLLRTFPDYYDVEDFHVAQDLFHVGP